MAAPESKNIHNLNGKWQMNKSLSDSFESVLSLQGVGFLIRKGIGAATLTLHISQSKGAPSEPAQDPVDTSETVEHINIDQVITGGIKGTTEKRCADNRRREHTDWLFGHVSGRTLFYASAADVSKDFADEFLVQGFGDQEVLVSHVVNLDDGKGWVATQVWGFQTIKDGSRRYVRNVVVTKGEGSKQQRVAVQLIYDFLGELDKEEDLAY